MSARVDLVVMDMAGTTVQDNHEVESCFAAAAQEVGLQASAEEILAIQGWSKRYVFEMFWEKQLGSRQGEWADKVECSYQVFKSMLEDHYRKHPVVPTVGALESFAFLRQHHIKIALTTGFYREVTDIILERLGWLAHLDANYRGNAEAIIDFSISSDQVAQGRPAPDLIFAAMKALEIDDPQRVICIGDTPSDILCGRNAGCLYVLALSNGTHPAEKLAAHEPDALLPSLAALPDFLREKGLVTSLVTP